MKEKFTSIIISILFIGSINSCGGSEDTKDSILQPELLKKHCGEIIGKPKVEQISKHVWVAIGYDLANVVLINTEKGNIIVDTGMSPGRARLIKKDLYKKAPKAPVLAIIYTHSHIDHIGGAAEWQEKGTQIWATDEFKDHFFKQYGVFMKIETIRGKRQFGDHISLEDLPCNGIGRRTDIKAALESGVRIPTHTFSGTKVLNFGSVKIEIIEAHGETHDHLFVWVPEDKTLITGDNFYWTFPNLYTIRGTSPRPVNDWIVSLDMMRKMKPEHLVPCHTQPIHGSKEISQALTNYRDSIQWVRDEVVRGANRGDDIDTLAENIKLPPHLAKYHYNKEFYGQVDWSVRAIYTNNLGWFDGRPDALYPPESVSTAKREVELMGGPGKIIKIAEKALKDSDEKWAIHLLAKLKRSKLSVDEDELNQMLIRSYTKLASKTFNLNGRGYLLESAYELKEGMEKRKKPKLSNDLVVKIPIEKIFYFMTLRLKAEDAMDVHESVHFVFPDEKKRFIVTVRNGITEAVQGDPLPGTPEPVATLTVDSNTYKKIALQIISPVSALASGKLKIAGSWLGFLKFIRRFERGV